MKRLKLIGQKSPTEIETYKDSLVRAISEYVGPDGVIAFEHGYRPTFNAQMITDKEVILRFRIGKNKRERIPLEEFDQEQLKNIIVEIVKYENHCHLRA